MRYRLLIRPEAEADLREAFDWYEQRMPGLGDDFLMAVDTAIDSILANPFQHATIRRDARRALTRRFPYQVFFVAEDDVITIIAVSHGARDPKRWQERT